MYVFKDIINMTRIYLGGGTVSNEMADKHNVSNQQNPRKQMIFQIEILPQLSKCLYKECRAVCFKK